jgi:uncharacterized membrane protein SpoIIM required for sporulation/ABC-type transport system involved in multi-copper enzyme maturation permease subunit
MLEAIRPALILTRREVRDQFRDWRIIFPILGLTLFFPFLMNFTADQVMNFVRDYGANIVGERLIPFLLMVVGFFPISVSLVIALESFVGEKERGSIEPLLNTPLEDWQLYLGKLLSSIVSPLVGSYLGMTVYLVGLSLQNVPLPAPNLLVLIIVLTTVQAVMMVAGAVVVSSQATSVRAANLLASFIIIPVALLIQGESVVMFWGNISTLWWIVFGLCILTTMLIKIGLSHFHREELLGREFDVLNLKLTARTFMQRFRGGATSLGSWYAGLFKTTIWNMRLPILLSTGLALAGFIVGFIEVRRFTIAIDTISLQDVNSSLQTLLKVWPLFSVSPVMLIWWQNFRTLLMALVLGIFSMGVLGTIPMIATLGITGYLMGILNVNGISFQSFAALILPHGIIEIPVAILATAAVMQIGAFLVKPSPDKTVGEVILLALADWAKITLGIVMPALLLAAAIEAWITPRLTLWLFH